MSYLVIARKYRPSAFDSVIGQRHVVQTLKNAITKNRIGHAYLLTGPRGVGKTSIARIFAKCLNCQNIEEGQQATVAPCGDCNSCNEIARGISLSVVEIDGASHNSVDNVRELIDTFRSLPPPGYRYKVYIIDEVHMLSLSAFNALLKSLEEPPPNTVFILATTELHKIPETVLSRCQRHDLRALLAQQIYDKLSEIIQSEGLSYEEPALRLIAKAADGSLRDGQSLLERIISYCGDNLTETSVVEVLGLVEKNILFQLSESIFTRNVAKVLDIIRSVFATGVDSTSLLKQFVSHFREALIIKYANQKDIEELSLTSSEVTEFRRQIEVVNGNDIQDLVSIALTGADQALRSFYVRYSFEALLVRMASREPVFEIGKLIARIEGDKTFNVKSGSSLSDQTSYNNVNNSCQVAQAHSSQNLNYSADRHVVSTERLDVDTYTDSIVADLSNNKAEKYNTIEEKHSNTNESKWNSFVSAVLATGEEKLFSEQLKRVIVDEFSEGKLKIKASEFVAKYLQSAENKTKLTSLLNRFIMNTQWKIDFHVVTESDLISQGTTVLMKEKVVLEKVRKEKESKAKEHPALKNIQAVFPGSVIEGVRSR